MVPVPLNPPTSFNPDGVLTSFSIKLKLKMKAISGKEITRSERWVSYLDTNRRLLCIPLSGLGLMLSAAIAQAEVSPTKGNTPAVSVPIFQSETVLPSGAAESRDEGGIPIDAALSPKSNHSGGRQAVVPYQIGGCEQTHYAQVPLPEVDDFRLPEEDGTSPSRDPLPEAEPTPLPDLEELLDPEAPGPPQDDLSPTGDRTVITIERFEVLGSTVFSDEALEAATQKFTGRVTFDQVLEARDAITQLYLDAGYITSGALVLPQEVQNEVATIQVLEGGVEDIVITGTTRLNPGYVSSRLNLGTRAPLQVDRLLERLQLLQLDPLIENISADLQAGTRPGENLLVVSVVEADSFDVRYTFDNARSPTVGSLRHQVQITERNLTGLGDALSLGYALTEGSDDFDVVYTIPINPYNGTLRFTYGSTNADILEDPFEALNISSDATVAEITLRQPLVQTPTLELALGLVASRQETQTFLDGQEFFLSAGASNEGETVVTALRFFQEWTQRSPRHVTALRSQFNLGIDALDATVNTEDDIPDSQFFSWLGQGQWVRLMAPDTLLLLRGSVQLTADPLLGLERYGLGGPSSVRGYRQNDLLTDNGAILSLEARFPVWRDRDNDGLLQITPFIEGGYGWNNREDNPETNGLLSAGAGLLLQVENLDFRIDVGIPLIDTEDNDTLQERGIHFSLGYSFF